MFNFEVIEIDNPQWDEIVKSSFIYDFHHTSFYHKLDNSHRSLLFVANAQDDFIAMPLVIRPIDGTDYFDATSVYGYCGPISKYRQTEITSGLISFFKSSLNDFFKVNNIVSAFSRLHSLIDNHLILQDLGTIVELNKTVAIDLRQTPEEQRRLYRKSNKSEVNQLRKKGFVVEEVKVGQDIDRFVDIYYETMDRVNATPYYYFSREYFHSFMQNDSFGTKLLVARHEGRIAAGAIFTITNKIMQYHLAGTTEDYMRLTPMKLILDEARLLGNTLGPEYLHLGGGVGGKDDDSLFRFKSGFSNHHFQFSIWKYIVDPIRYQELVHQKGINSETEPSFFPLYRSVK